VAKRSHAHQRADRLDVASGLAYETADVAIGELDLDGDGAAAALKGLDVDLFGFLGQRFGDVLDQRAVVHTRAGGPWRTLAPVAAVVAPAAAVTPRRSTSVSLIVAQGSPPASTGSARLRSAERPGGASAPLCRRRS